MTQVIQVTLNPLSAQRVQLPKFLKGFKAESLQNLQTSLNTSALQELGLEGVEYWPADVQEQIPSADQKLGDEILVPDAQTKTVAVSYEIVDKTEEELAADLEVRRKALIQKAKEAKTSAFYSNPTIPFPVTEKEIHFRNETDRANISDKTMQAFINVSAGNGSTEMKFTPVDGIPVTMTSQELLTAFAGLATAKDALFYAYNGVISDLEAAIDNNGLDSAEEDLNAL